MCQIIRSLNASGVFSGYFRRRTCRNKGPFDIPAAAVQSSIATFTNGGMDTLRILFLAHEVDEHPAAVALLDVPRLERRELAPAPGAVQKHRQNRAVPFSFHSFKLGLSEQAARLFAGKPIPCPGAGLADALERHNSLEYLIRRTQNILYRFGVVRDHCQQHASWRIRSGAALFPIAQRRRREAEFGRNCAWLSPIFVRTSRTSTAGTWTSVTRTSSFSPRVHAIACSSPWMMRAPTVERFLGTGAGVFLRRLDSLFVLMVLSFSLAG
jgi:hypothetical protein